MNERLKQLMIQADYPAPELALRAHRLAELMVFECTKVILFGGYRNPALGEKHPLTPPEIATMVKEHFGVEEQVTEPSELHTCPYAEEIHGDYETLCDCDEEATRQCAMDI